MAATDDLAKAAMTQPLPGLLEDIAKRLNANRITQLQCWIETEQQAGAAEEWSKQKDRVTVFEELRKVVAEFLSLWPLSGYELEAYCDATLVPTLREILARVTEGAKR